MTAALRLLWGWPPPLRREGSGRANRPGGAQFSECVAPRATPLAGMVHASFLFAHFGGETVSGDLGRATWAVLGLGLFTRLPLLWIANDAKPNKNSDGGRLQEKPYHLRERSGLR